MGLSPWSGSWWGALLLPGETEGVARIPHPAPWQGQAPTAARTPAWGGGLWNVKYEVGSLTQSKKPGPGLAGMWRRDSVGP